MLSGPLGAGKTIFVKGIAAALGTGIITISATAVPSILLIARSR